MVKMKVSVLKLKKVIEKHDQQEQVRFTRETERYSKAQEHNRKVHRHNVNAYLRMIEAGGEIITGYQLQQLIDRGLKSISEPKPARSHQDMLTKLDLCVEGVIEIDSQSEFYRLLSSKCTCER